MEQLKTLLYFSIFNYPLKIDEIHNYSKNADISLTLNNLNELLSQKIIQQNENFYYYNKDELSIENRIKANKNAEKSLTIALSKAKFIYKFPFVKAVGITGSLSKNCMYENSDIDFIVITKENRLWICRTFIILYRRIFKLNSRKYFCTNYFISESQLQISEQNIFTATEIKTLIPVINRVIFEESFNKNLWISKYFLHLKPNFNQILNVKKNTFRKFIELLFDNKIGNFIDTLLLKLMKEIWKIRYKDFILDDFNIAFKSTKNVSKNHGYGYQKIIINKLNAKFDEIKQKYNIDIPKENA